MSLTISAAGMLLETPVMFLAVVSRQARGDGVGYGGKDDGVSVPSKMLFALCAWRWRWESRYPRRWIFRLKYCREGGGVSVGVQRDDLKFARPEAFSSETMVSRI
jgi:hypothetical protein